MTLVYIVLGFLLLNAFVWFLLFDEYDTQVRGWQQTNFTVHERTRLAVLLPGLPLLLLLVLIVNARQWRKHGAMLRNFADATKDHWSIIRTGSKAGYEKTAA